MFDCENVFIVKGIVMLVVIIIAGCGGYSAMKANDKRWDSYLQRVEGSEKSLKKGNEMMQLNQLDSEKLQNTAHSKLIYKNGIMYLRFPDGESFHIHYSKVQKMLHDHIFKNGQSNQYEE